MQQGHPVLPHASPQLIPAVQTNHPADPEHWCNSPPGALQLWSATDTRNLLGPETQPSVLPTPWSHVHDTVTSVARLLCNLQHTREFIVFPIRNGLQQLPSCNSVAPATFHPLPPEILQLCLDHINNILIDNLSQAHPSFPHLLTLNPVLLPLQCTPLDEITIIGKRLLHGLRRPKGFSPNHQQLHFPPGPSNVNFTHPIGSPSCAGI